MKLPITIFSFFYFISCYSQQLITYTYDKENRLIQINYPNQSTKLYSYDANGNRTQSKYISSITCLGSTASFYAGIGEATSYQWQVNTGSGYSNVANGTPYIGETSSILYLNNPPASWYGYKYRCIITTSSGQSFSSEQTLKFQSTWKGGIDSTWENPGNWDCNKVPDAYTDVIVNAGNPFNPVVNSNVFVRSILLTPTVNLKVNPPFALTITNY